MLLYAWARRRMKMFERLFGPFLYFRFGMKCVAKLSSGFPREVALDRAMAYAKTSGIEGDYLECGVFRGERFAAASYLSRKRGLTMSLYAFDSFAGIPKNQEMDSSGYKRCTNPVLTPVVRWSF